jgi:hypothetical protein
VTGNSTSDPRRVKPEVEVSGKREALIRRRGRGATLVVSPVRARGPS